MNKEIKDKLLEFAIYGDYKISFDDAVHFVIKFLDNQGIEVTDSDIVDVRKRWCERYNFDYDELFGEDDGE